MRVKPASLLPGRARRYVIRHNGVAKGKTDSVARSPFATLSGHHLKQLALPINGIVPLVAWPSKQIGHRFRAIPGRRGRSIPPQDRFETPQLRIQNRTQLSPKQYQ
jgi:hypothetical protein